MTDWDTVREIAKTFPGTEESTTYGKPAFKAEGELFAWMSPDDAADGALAVRVDPGKLPFLVETAPERSFQTPTTTGIRSCA